MSSKPSSPKAKALKNKTTGEKNKMQRSTKTTLSIARGALIAALYVALTEFSFLLGLANGVIQFRLSEILCILPIFFPEAIFGLGIGCFISNIMTGCLPWDIFLGSLATFIGALGAFLLRKVHQRLKWIATIPTILANALIVPPVLIFAYDATDAYFFILATVSLGEIVCAGIGGSILYYSLVKTPIARLNFK